MSLPLHGFYILCLVLFTFLVCLVFFLFSFDTLLSYFNYPLVESFLVSSIFPLSFGSTLACILPPLFLIGAVRRYGLKERFIRMFEVQSLFFLLLLMIFSGFMYYSVQLDDNVVAIMNIHYFSTFSRILMCIYFYLSIKVCITSQNIYSPLDFEDDSLDSKNNSNELQYELQGDFTFHDDDKFHALENEKWSEQGQKNHAYKEDTNTQSKQTEFINDAQSKRKLRQNAKSLRNKAWEKHQEKLPQIVKSSLGFAQLLGFGLVALALFPVSELPFPAFSLSYSFLPVFFLYFYLLYQMRIRPYAVWRLPYICLNLYILINYGLGEIPLWQFIISIFFICQCFVFFVFYKKSKNWFLQ